MKPELVDHRKFLRLKRLLGEPTPHVIGYLMLMWRRGYQTGNPLLGDELDVEAAAEYLGEPRKFATAAHESGFLDRTEENLYLIHDLWEHAPEWARKRMARHGFLPDGMDEYSGIKPKVRHAAAKSKKQTPRGGEIEETDATRHTDNREKREERRDPFAASPPVAEPLPPERRGKAPKPPPKPRAPDELFDAIVAVTGCDPSVNGSHVGRVKKVLLAADPPYTPAEILRMGTPEFQRMHMPWLEGRTLLNVGEVQSHAYRTRLPDVVANSDAKRTGRDRFRADTDPVADKYTPQGIARLRGESASPVAGNAAAVGPPDGPSPAEPSAGEAGGNGDGLSW